ncbi:tetratricopeptide repeat protein [Zoogloea sp. 1C4]|uniref:tetratricopeptide repeat protein n=1 Tax=Zoogloea sp. 1C4 TaxID=2570190 RepID=UPI001290E03A|nr:tetratricopeptide repeat protein [Zoogloea sp. 1C4]
MSLLLNALRKADESRRPTDPAPTRPMGGALELEPLPLPASPGEPARPAIAPPPTPPAGTPARPPLPDWRLATLFACLGALVTGLWLALTPATLPISPAHAAPSPRFVMDDATVEEEPVPAPAQAANISKPSSAPTPSIPAAAVQQRPQPPRPTPLAPPADSPRFRPSPAAPASPSAVTLAHDAYTAGNLAHADALYRQALAADPNNADALNGLGAIALIQRRPAEADTLFRRALLARPLDPTALSGLARIQSSSQTSAESPLRDAIAALADTPDSLAPRLALADLLARQQRWAEAQQAYFDAHRLAPLDADIAYNLAISLDHLGQHRLAASHYRKALSLAARLPDAATRFSRARCAERLATLQPFDSTP